MKINELKDDLIKVGLKVNLYLALLLYYACAVRRTPWKMSVLVTGPSGIGKSYVTKSVISLMPEGDIITTSKMTAAALVRYGDLRNKIVHIYEKFKDRQLDQYVRELISEEEVMYKTVNAEYVLKGPSTFVETTANPNIIGAENKTRYFVVNANSSKEAISDIMERQKLLRSKDGLSLAKDMYNMRDKHKRFQRTLDPSIAVLLPKGIRLSSFSPHAPRILERFQNLMAAVAFVDQRSRDKVELNGRLYIEAIREDFEHAKEILTNLSIDEEETVLSRNTLDFANILRENKEALMRKGSFLRSDVMNIISKSHYRWRSYGNTKKQLSILCDLGFITKPSGRGPQNRIEYEFNKLFKLNITSEAMQDCYSSLRLD